MLLTVRNVGRILDLYDLEAPEWGPTEAGTALGLGKSRAQALMASMAEVGLLRRVAGGRYRIGWRPLQLEKLVAGSTPFRAPAHEVAMRLAHHTGETLHVATLDGGRVVYVDRVHGTRGVDIEVSTVGATLPAHCSGVGKVLLAHLEPGQIDAILDSHGLPLLTPATITDRDALYAELHRVRRDGVAFDREEVMAGLSCVAAPIRDFEGTVVAAISISAPTERFNSSHEAYRSMIVRAAEAVSRRLHRSPVTPPSEIAGRRLAVAPDPGMV